MSWLSKTKESVLGSVTSQGSNTTPLSEQAMARIDALEKLRRVQEAALMNMPSVYTSNSGAGGGAGGLIYQSAIGAQGPGRWSAREKILMRLNTPEGHLFGFDFIEATHLNDEKMVVFIVNDGKHVTLEDDRHLFPSDTLITQLRLLRK